MIRLEPDLENKVVELARNGNRPKFISQQTGYPEHIVRKIIHRNKINIVAQLNSSTIDLYKIIADLISGVSLSEIARRYSVTRQYIYRIKNKCLSAGIPVKKKDASEDTDENTN